VAILHVDDLITLASHIIQLKRPKLELEKKIEMYNLEYLYYCLGVKFEKNRLPIPLS
jgi:hypothetical protein